jgi:uncharacterized protein YeeX (DUF496 family)
MFWIWILLLDNVSNYIKVTMSFSKIKSNNYAQNYNEKSKPQNKKLN